MTFQPVLPWPILVAVAAALLAIRLLSLHRLRAKGRRTRIPLWRWCAVTVAVLLIVVAAARPGVGTAGQKDATATVQGGNLSVFYVVDRSAAGGVADYGDGKPRMDGVRADITALTARYPQARFALITFASRPSLDWPLSADTWSLEPETSALAADDAPAADTQSQVDAAAAANVLRYQLIAAGQQYPGSRSLVFYFGYGAPGSRAPQGEFDLPAGRVDGGAVFGYGVPSGGPQALNETELRRVASQLGVPYVHRGGSEPLPETAEGTSGQDQAVPNQAAPSAVADRTELYWVFALMACALLLFEVYLTVRELRRTRAAHRDVVL